MIENQGDSAAIIDLAEMQAKALRVVMYLFKECIIYQRDAPDEARVMLFPAFLHISRDVIEAEIKARYAREPCLLSKDQDKLTEDERIIKEGVDDAIAILRAKTGNQFTIPGQGELKDYEIESLTELAHVEATTFYRIQMEDVVRGFIYLARGKDGEIHALKIGQPPGTRIRHWGAAQKIADVFMPILIDDTMSNDEKIDAMIENDAEESKGYGKWFLRLMERGLLGTKKGN